MKKIILCLVFVFATSNTIINANTLNMFGESCFEKADRQATNLAIWLNLSLDEEHIAFGVLYDDCMGDNSDEFVF